ncbi:MAG: type 1 glutamine amidotransferase [Casimicrobiaceae bacterium]
MPRRMPPIAVLRFSPTEGPAYFAQWLDRQQLAWELVALDAGAPLPSDPRAYGGIAMMGGPMSVNDALPWIEPVCALLRDAVDARIPVIGHCLGGQLLARALGAKVTRTAQPEIGWIDVQVDADGPAREWFGARAAFTAFQWHYDAFALPPGASRVLSNAYNQNQAYTLDDRHIGMQCHVEMTAELVDTWCRVANDELPAYSTAAMHSEASIREGLAARIDALQAVASSIYARWIAGLRR